MFLLRGIEFPERWYYLFGREQDFSCFSQNALLLERYASCTLRPYA